MKAAVRRAQSRPRLASPAIHPLAMLLVDLIGPLYARLALGIASTRLMGGELLIEAFREFYSGESRLLLAFRHPYGDEPQMLGLALHLTVPAEARRQGRSLRTRPHCLFLHGYEVPLWSGPLVRWLLPRTGAMPVYHVSVDRAGLRRIRDAFRDGPHPLSLAPEGQASYRSETLPRLEAGALQLGFWCATELEAADRPERVLVLPLSFHVERDAGDLGALERRAARLEKQLGLPGEASSRKAASKSAALKRVPSSTAASTDGPSARRETVDLARQRALGLRLRLIDLALLGLAEAFYGLGGDGSRAEPEGIEGSPGLPEGSDFVSWREARRQAILEEALHRGEALLGLDSGGTIIDRVYRLRHVGWSLVYPELDLAALPPLERQLADRRAGEAWYAMRHMEVVDLAYYLDAAYLEDGLRDGGAPSVGRLAETLCNLGDLATRLVGGNITDRRDLHPRRVVIVAEPPLELRSRLADYRADRHAALDAAQADLSKAFHHAIKEYLDGQH